MRRLALWVLLPLLACARALAQAVPDKGTPDLPLVVEALECRGNASTSCTFILGQVYLAEGDPVDEEELQNAKLRLLFLRNFESVSIYLEKGSARGKARVVIEVTEANPLTTELGYGLAFLGSSVGHTLDGRATHYNLLGTGKIFDVRASATMPITGPEIEEYFVRAQFIDPHLFDSKRAFFSAGASYLYSNVVRSNGDVIHNQQGSFDATLGYRVWDFSYFTVGYQRRPLVERNATVRQRDGRFDTSKGRRSGVLVYGFGWNSEDDAYFPTRGSRLESGVILSGDTPESSSLLYRRTWSWARTVWTAEYQKENIFGLSMAVPLSPDLMSNGIQRGRWFAGASIEPNGFTKAGDAIRAIGANVGVRLETQKFGIVELSLSYSTDFTP